MIIKITKINTSLTAVCVMMLILGCNSNVSDRSTLFNSISSNDFDSLARFLANHNVDINSTKNAKLNTLLSEASCSEDPRIVLLLLSYQADPDAPSSITPLVNAVMNKNETTIDLLLAVGADPNVPESHNGVYPLHLAYDANIARKLMTHSARVNVTAKDGQTPLHAAVSFENVYLVEEYCKAGALTDALDKNGRTPSDYVDDIYISSQQDRDNVERIRSILKQYSPR